ncbi:MAG: hypothetical protein JW963_02790 [Anaerolineales bacterium]|nr:hypothetical protein [Anaerolineales bacterium]
MPMVWSIRNVVYSGILRSLAEAGWHVHLLMPEYDPQALQHPEYADFALAAGIQPLVLPMKQRRYRVYEPLTQIVRSAFHQRNKIRSFAIYRRWLGRHYDPRARYRERFIDLLGQLAQPAPMFDRLVRWSETLYRRMYDLEPVRAKLAALQPDLVWSTICVKPQEYPYVLACHDLNITVVTSILSFDNLTSRTTIPSFNHYLVWNQRMKDQLMAYYPQIAPEQVTITGTPQFDFHRKSAFRWSREKTLERLSLPNDARYILYTCSAEFLAPDEPKLVAQLAHRLADDPVLRHHWLVVRLHPLDNWTRWQSALDASDRVVVSHPWATRLQEDGWTLSCPEDQGFWVSSLLYSECCINIASTTSLDAAILDRPVIGIRFDQEVDAPREILYEEYEAEHYIHLVQSGGVQLAHSWNELLELIRDAGAHPKRWQAERAQMVAQEIGQADGQAAERVIEALEQAARSG